MKRTGAALRRVFALASLSLTLAAGTAATAHAQEDLAPQLFPAPMAAHPIGRQMLPPVTAVGYYDGPAMAAVPGPACVAGAPCDVGACNPWQGPANSCGACDGCGACDAYGCGGCNDCACCGPCYAGPRCMDPWYLSLSGGWQYRESANDDADPLLFLEFDDGFAVNGALGYRFNLFRVETEISFMNNEVDRAGGGALAAGLGVLPSDATGNVNLRALMFNLYHDIDLGFTCWRPYVGAGIGFYQSEINSLYPQFFGDPLMGAAFNNTPVNATSDVELAYQFRAGASRVVGERTEIFIGYRYFHGEDATFAAAPLATPATPTFNLDADVHSAEVGLRVRF
jgi:opacity protein-like surface antigen